ncbi:DEAD/DEAH box helicase family protein [Reichenbachiella sp.]|uniref:DEAD/DEAH box helicase family protein n=1 Tax=Reichenbachiella sp. TaxID=2184521 RepID=UPI003BAFB06C
MKEFSKDIQFKYPWRKYQQRVLNELDEHLNDNHLHVIAPPGSGKTVLGLEVMLRLNKPTLILAPTIAIRNQWIERFRDLFLQTESSPKWISRSIKEPKFITVSTYQGLHAACTGDKIIEDEFEELETEDANGNEKDYSNQKLKAILKALKEQNIGTIIIDEAHHLKNAWWKSLMAIKEDLSPTMVGLTATPPYDVSYQEWNRYIELNGPVDTEISVPELVKEGDLCPHQDYILFSQPKEDELKKIKEFRDNRKLLYNRLGTDKVVVNHLLSLSVIQQPGNNYEWIYSHMEYYSALLIYLNHNKVELSDEHFRITGNKKTKIPSLDKRWLELLIDYYLNHNQSDKDDIIEHKKYVISLLRKNSAFERKRINITDDSIIESQLKSSLSKLDSIVKITQFEKSHLSDNLRLVILGDFIRKEFLSDKTEINKLGVIPIFEKLRRDSELEVRLGVLTGSLIIIPQTALGKMNEVAEKYGIKSIRNKPLEYDPKYLIINVNDKLRHDVVHIVTQVFQAGEISVLVGTKSLLGEGWDAPSINALILASFVGSFVLSNQMRGRAIRTVQGDTEKTGNIWHLVCNDPTSPNGGSDLQVLSRRFKGFVGISERENRTIENGLQRMEIPEKISYDGLEYVNSKMLESAGDRDLLRDQWHQAIENGTILTEEIKIPFPEEKSFKKVKRFYLNRTIAFVLAELSFGITIYTQEFLNVLGRVKPRSEEVLEYLFMLFLIVGFVIFGAKLFKSAKLLLKYRDISKDIQNIGAALLRSLVKTKNIHTTIDKLEIRSSVNDYGEVFCHLEGGTTYEKSLFIKSLQEIISPVDSPRYLIIRRSTLFNLFDQKDYHPVPEALGKHKSFVKTLDEFWKRLVGSCTTIFTRNETGRKALLKARFHSLASEFQKKSERTNRWK